MFVFKTQIKKKSFFCTYFQSFTLNKFSILNNMYDDWPTKKYKHKSTVQLYKLLL